MPCFLCSSSFLKVHLHHAFYTFLSTSFDEKLSQELLITKFQFQDHVMSQDKFGKICGTFFGEMFPPEFT